jgi:hypothetical protein
MEEIPSAISWQLKLFVVFNNKTKYCSGNILTAFPLNKQGVWKEINID